VSSPNRTVNIDNYLRTLRRHAAPRRGTAMRVAAYRLLSAGATSGKQTYTLPQPKF